MQDLVIFTYRQETSGQANPLKGVMIDGEGLNVIFLPIRTANVNIPSLAYMVIDDRAEYVRKSIPSLSKGVNYRKGLFSNEHT